MMFRLRAFFSIVFSALLFVALPTLAAQPLVVVHPDRPSVRDARYDFQISLLKLALDKSGVPYQMRPSKFGMEQGRMLTQLEKGLDVDVVWSMTSREREQHLLPIRIPIDKGLIGYRVFLVRPDKLAQFAQVHTLEQLRQFEAGQGSFWPDTEILRANDLLVYGATVYENLFSMLEAERFDYFPRSITEIWDELKARPDRNLVVEPSILLYYPAAAYFFVNKQNKVLARTIETGLRTAIRDGSFDQLFQTYYGEFIRKANLGNRTVIRLNNPLLPAETPLQQKQLWFQPPS
ncbi:MAG: transporter substrate-binding domain-containing protein [Proteobacteria bacterium]|nr:transporter substrate-binding domain-containing protein [Pseudomonadota bacterium]